MAKGGGANRRRHKARRAVRVRVVLNELRLSLTYRANNIKPLSHLR